MKTDLPLIPQFVETKLLDLFPRISTARGGLELPDNFTTHTFYRKTPKGTEICTVDGLYDAGCYYVYASKLSKEKEKESEDQSAS